MLNESSKKKHLPIIIILAVVLVGVSAYFMVRPGVVNDQQALPTETPQATVTTAPSSTPVSSPVGESSPSPVVSAVKTFNVVGSNFSFSPKEIKVKKGDRVKIIFQNSGGMHNWVIDEFNARTSVLQSGQKAEVEFVADKTGTFEYYCSVGSHRAMGMKGNLIVE